jgi:hypothetical protein
MIQKFQNHISTNGRNGNDMTPNALNEQITEYR